MENLPTMDDFNFNNFLSNRLMGGAGYCCSSYCCFCKFAFGNLISQNCCFCLFPPLWKTPVTAAFAKLFQTTSSRKSYWQISLVLMPICFNITVCWLSADRSVLYERSRSLLLSQSGLKQLLWESLTGKLH